MSDPFSDTNPLCAMFGTCKEYLTRKALRDEVHKLQNRLRYCEARLRKAEERMAEAATALLVHKEVGDPLKGINVPVARQRRKQRLRKRGLSPEWYDTQLFAQGGVCAICGEPPPANGRLCIDHNHTTGAVRGLLCNACNTGIGCLRENPKIFQAALQYLTTHKG